MVILFDVDDCLIFNPYMDKVYDVYISLRAYFKIEDNVEINKYLGIDMYRLPYS